MIFKIAGIIAIFSVCTAAGIYKSTTLSHRVKELEGFLGAMSMISTDIRYLASPTGVIIEKLDESPEYKALHVFSFCRQRFGKTNDISKAWPASVDDAKPLLALNEGDLDAIRNFGCTLGTTDTEGQTANCARCCELLRSRLESAREDKAKRGRMFTSLGVLSGVFFAVLLL